MRDRSKNSLAETKSQISDLKSKGRMSSRDLALNEPLKLEEDMTITQEMFFLMKNSKLKQLRESIEDDRFKKKIMCRNNASKRRLKRLRNRNILEREIND